MLRFSIAIALLIIPFFFQPVMPLTGFIAVLNVCGYKTPVNPGSIRNMLFSPGSLGDTFANCSYGLSSIRLKILPDPIYIPCNIFQPGTCSYDAWVDYADSLIRDANLLNLQHAIYIVPYGPPCNWAGLGMVGCGTRRPCRVWINGQFAMVSDTYFHELGHNMGLNHAASIKPLYKGADLSYSDFSCGMGYCCSRRCYNAPHSEQLGWMSEGIVIDRGTFPIGTNNTYYLKDARSSRSAYLRVQTEWAWVYIEYRRNKGIDSGLPYSSVNIITTPIGNALGIRTVLQASLQFPRQYWKGYGLRVILYTNTNTNSVKVYITRIA